MALKVEPTRLFKALLAEAEQRFGKATSFGNIKVEGRDLNIPETIVDAGERTITVYFANEARGNFYRLRFQLAHEVIHVLSGECRRDATKFEEGLAVYFSLNLRGASAAYDKQAKDELPALFKEAFDLFSLLNPTDDKIKQLRDRSSNLGQVTSALVMEVFGVPRDLADILCTRVPTEMSARQSSPPYSKS